MFSGHFYFKVTLTPRDWILFSLRVIAIRFQSFSNFCPSITFFCISSVIETFLHSFKFYHISHSFWWPFFHVRIWPKSRNTLFDARWSNAGFFSLVSRNHPSIPPKSSLSRLESQVLCVITYVTCDFPVLRSCIPPSVLDLSHIPSVKTIKSPE